MLSNNIKEISNLLKLPTTFEEQLLKLEKEYNVKVENKNKSLEFLKNNNYYTLSGYLFLFNKSVVKFEDMQDIMEFDNKFRAISLYIISLVEKRLKTNMAYNFSHNYKYGNISYIFTETFYPEKLELSEEKYEEQVNLVNKIHEKFMKEFDRAKKYNKHLDFVRHHNSVYKGYLPIWVAVELFTLGNLQYFYKLLNKKTKDMVVKSYGLKTYYFESWLDAIRKFRNSIAHNQRLYGLNIQHIKQSKKTPYHSGKVFDYILVCKNLFTEKGLWNNYILIEIEKLFKTYPQVKISMLGFPDNWLELLSI